jgi:hypothetical protein
MLTYPVKTGSARFFTLVSDSSVFLEFLFLTALDGHDSRCVHYLVVISHFLPDSYLWKYCGTGRWNPSLLCKNITPIGQSIKL